MADASRTSAEPALLAGRSVTQVLATSTGGVGTHVRSILGKLDLPVDGGTHRRVMAVVTYLRTADR